MTDETHPEWDACREQTDEESDALRGARERAAGRLTAGAAGPHVTERRDGGLLYRTVQYPHGETLQSVSYSPSTA